MILQAIFFYLFAGVCVASAIMVIAAKNPVHSVLFLILAFVNAAGLFMLMGAEFLAMILIVVYVGAVAVLFLFVVMMLDVDFTQLRQGFLNYLPVGALVGLGIPEEEAKYYETEVKGGRVLVTVKADGRYDEAYAILRRFGAYDVNTRRAAPAAGNLAPCV